MSVIASRHLAARQSRATESKSQWASARRPWIATAQTRLAMTAASALLTACTLGPDFETPSVFTPSSWFATRPVPPKLASVPAAEPIDPRWWNALNDPVLTGLIERAAASNLDVQAATARLAQSRAQRVVTGAAQFPTLNGNTSYTREKPSKEGATSLFGSAAGGSPGTQSNGLGGRQGGIPSPIGQPFDLYQYGFDASWELDLWGRVRRQVESADATVEASAETRRNTLLTSLAELARNYVQLRGTQRTIQITRENLESAQQSAHLTDERARAGLASDLDVANAQAQASTTAAQLPQLEAQAQQQMNMVALLLGAPPGAMIDELTAPKPVPPVPPRVPVGVPSELVRRRPDVRQSEAQLHAATADIGEAQAEFFPAITLSGSAALQSLQFKNLGSLAASTYSFGPSITIPIFEGGRLRGTLDLRKAAQQEAAINYQKAVLQAFHDVDNALVAYGAEQARRDALAMAVAQNRRALNLANQRYRQGLSDFLEVLTAQRSVLAAEQSLAESTTSVSTDFVQLYKALGGGWETEFPRVTAP